jgi:MFS family permease
MHTTHPTLRASLRSLPKAAWVLFFGTFLNKFGGFVVPFLTLYLTKRGYGVAEAGAAISAYGAGTLTASLLGGYLADTIGRRKTIVLSMFSGAAAMFLLSQVRSLPWIILITALAGLTGELYRPASSALLTDLVPAGQRVTAFSAYRMAFNAGWAFGPATAGFLAQRGYFWLFAGDAATSALFGLVAWFALPETKPSSGRNADWREAIVVIKADWRFHQILIAALLVGLVFLQMFSSFSLRVTDLGFSGATYGALLSLNGLLVVCCELPLTTITRRFPARRVMALGYLLIGGGFALNGIVHNVPGLAACVVSFTFGEMIAIPVAAAYVADLSPVHMRGRYMGVYGLMWSIAMVAGPAAGMKLFAAGNGALWISCGAITVLAAIVVSVRIPASSVKIAAVSVAEN